MKFLDEKLKQRLVGVMVLVALAIIFLPSLFHRKELVEIDTTTQIPPAPNIEPVVIAPPTKPENIEIPPPQELFRPQEPEEEVVVDSEEPSEAPSLTDKGVPAGWVVQVGSFKSVEGATSLVDGLLKKKLPAYKKTVETSQGQFVRVFVGPYIEQGRANEIKKQLDREYQVKSKIIRFNSLAGNT